MISEKYNNVVVMTVSTYCKHDIYRQERFVSTPAYWRIETNIYETEVLKRYVIGRSDRSSDLPKAICTEEVKESEITNHLTP